MATTYDKASLVMIPSGYKDDKLYSVKPTDGSGDFTFSRDGAGASPATRVNASGLIEKGRTNEISWSNDFSKASWVKFDLSATIGQSGYDGTNDAWSLSVTSGTQNQRMEQNQSVSGVQTFSVYAKAGSLNWMYVRVDGSGGNHTAYFDLQNGVVGSTTLLIDSNIESVGSGWYRCSVTFNDTTTIARIYTASGDGNRTQSSGNIIVQDVQHEAGLVATEIIDTEAPTSAGLLGDMPRLDYSGGATCPSLLLEPSRVNLFEQSEYFSGTYWAKTANGSGIAPVVTQNYATSPEGVQNASRVQFDTNGSSSGDRSGLVKDFAFTTGDKYAISCWVKSASGSDEIFTFRIAGAQVGGEKIATSEWQLFTETHTATTTTTDNFGIQIRGNYSSQTSDILIYGMQLEEASYPTSYIPTYGSAASRAADDCNKTGITSLIGQTEGVLFVEFEFSKDIDAPYRISLSDGTTANRIQLGTYGDAIQVYVQTGGATQVYEVTGTLSVGTTYKAALAYKANDYVCYLNGSQLFTDTSASVPACSKLGYEIPDGTGLFEHPIKQQVLFPTRLTNAELAALTA